MVEKDVTPETFPQEKLDELVSITYRNSRNTIAVVDGMLQRGAIKGEELEAISQLRSHCQVASQLCEEYESYK